MWQILEHRNVLRRVRKMPKQVLKRYEKWKDIVHLSGPEGLRPIRGFNDEPLLGLFASGRPVSSHIQGREQTIARHGY
jgi:hypothetical protein